MLVDLRARLRSDQLDGLSYVHLKQDLEADAIDWLGCDDPKPSERTDEMPDYGIPKTTQTLLAGIRTDLDSFCDAEAYALMYSGYRMMTEECERLSRTSALLFGRSRSAGKPAERGQPVGADWPFLCVERRMREPLDERGRLANILTVACQGAFKIWRLWRRGKAAAKWAAGAVALLPAAWLSWQYLTWLWAIWSAGADATVSISMLALALVPLAAAALFLVPLLRTLVGRTLNLLVFGVLGMLFAWIQLAIFDPFYLRYGREPGGFARRLLHEGKTRRALKIFERLVARDARDWLARVGLARALATLDRRPEAMAQLAAALKQLSSQAGKLEEEAKEAQAAGKRMLRRRQEALLRRKTYVEQLAASLAQIEEPTIAEAQAG